MCAKQVMRIEVNAIGFGLKDNNNGNARENTVLNTPPCIKRGYIKQSSIS